MRKQEAIDVVDKLLEKKNRPRFELSERIWKHYKKRIFDVIKFISNAYRTLRDNTELHDVEKIIDKFDDILDSFPDGKVIDSEYEKLRAIYPKLYPEQKSFTREIEDLKKVIVKTLPYWNIKGHDNAVKYYIAILNQLKEDYNIINQKFQKNNSDIIEYVFGSSDDVEKINEDVGDDARDDLDKGEKGYNRHVGDLKLVQGSLVSEIGNKVDEIIIDYKFIIGNFTAVLGVYQAIYDKLYNEASVEFTFLRVISNIDVIMAVRKYYVFPLKYGNNANNIAGVLSKLRSYRLLIRFTACLFLVTSDNVYYRYEIETIEKQLKLMQDFVDLVKRNGGSHRWVEFFLSGDRDDLIAGADATYGKGKW